jgi:hypothetical protein
MAGTLANAAAAALQAEAVKRESAKEEKVKKASPGASGRTGAQGGPKIGPVLVVGEGEKQAKNRRLLILVALALIGGVAAIVALSALRSPQRKALEAFAAPVDERYARYPNRLPRLQARAWLSSGPALVDLGSVHVGSTARHDLAGARPIVAAVTKDQTYLQQYDLWAPTADAGKIAKAWSAKKNRDANVEALKAANLDITTRDELAAKLQGAGLSADGVAVVMQLLLPTQGAPQDAAQRVGKGELPDAIEVSTFRGRKGTALQDAGNKYSYPTTDYSGKLLRFIGANWPQEWRVLEIDFIR